jgi:hypothetical protein
MQLRLASQPHGFLLDELNAVKAAKQQAEVRAVAAQTALRVSGPVHRSQDTS